MIKTRLGKDFLHKLLPDEASELLCAAPGGAHHGGVTQLIDDVLGDGVPDSSAQHEPVVRDSLDIKRT